MLAPRSGNLSTCRRQMQDLIPDALINTLRAARSVVVLTGAGVSAESGIPTFRDAMAGLWSKFDAYAFATPSGFEKDPGLVTKWYDWRRALCAKVEPNPAHLAIAKLQRYFHQAGRRFTLVTQNVDRLHQAAGSVEVVELHGTLWVWRCTRCGEEREEREVPFKQHPTKCARCGGNRRPGVVWFGEALPAEALAQAERAAMSCDLFLSVGTSSVVYPAAGLLDSAIAQKAKTVEINPELTAASDYVNWTIQGKAGEVLPTMIESAFA